MPLNELRQARGLSQRMLAELLHVQQPSIAKMEKRIDMYISLVIATPVLWVISACRAISRPWS